MFDLDYTEVLRKFDDLLARKEILYGSTTTVNIIDQGFAFEFQICPALRHKPHLKSEQPAWASDQLGVLRGSDIYNTDPAFFISPILNTHYLILNKFCVYRPQFILLTSDPSCRQQDPLTESDLAAVHTILKGSSQPMYAIYNCGEAAGCSRNHKHLQLFYQPNFPIFEQRRLKLQDRTPYIYFTQELNGDGQGDISSDQHQASQLAMIYKHLLAQCADALRISQSDSMTVPHNMVMTEDSMMLIPRRNAGLGKASANCAGMLGMVWIKDEAQLEEWTRQGPAKILAELGVPVENSLRGLQ